MSEQLADKIPERYEGQRKANKDVGNLAFPYSLYFVFYEQYAFIQVTLLTALVTACGGPTSVELLTRSDFDTARFFELELKLVAILQEMSYSNPGLIVPETSNTYFKY